MDKPHSDISRPVVLVVDDNRSSVELMGMMLESRGYDVIAAYSGTEAVERVEEALSRTSLWQPIPIDVVLLGIMTPGSDAFKVCQRIKGDPLLEHVPIVMVTAPGASGDKVAAVEFGADGYITKPFLPEELAAAVKAKLQIKRREEVLLRRNWELTAINAVCIAAGSTLDPERVLTASMEALMAHADIPAAAIYRYDEAGQWFRRAAQQGISRPEALPAQDPLLGRILGTQSPLLKADLKNDPEWCFEGPERPEMETFAGVPLRGVERSLGVLEVYRRQAYGFAERDVEFLTQIGDRIGAALQNAELFQRTQALLLKSSALTTGVTSEQ